MHIVEATERWVTEIEKFKVVLYLVMRKCRS
jgi:hypothetical protein